MDPKLVVNPRFWMEPIRAGGKVVRVTIQAPMKERGLQFFYIDRKDHPDLFQLVVTGEPSFRQMTAEQISKIPSDQRERLQAIGVLIPESEVSNAVHFHCFLNEEILEWMSPRHRQEFAFEASLTDSIVNPTFHYQPGDQLPTAIDHRVRMGDRFLRGYPLVWIENPGTHLLTAYWVGKGESEIVSTFKPGERSPSSLGPRLRKVLEAARILVSPDYLERCRSEWDKVISEGRAQFQSRTFVTFSDIIPPFYLAALRRYCRDIVAEGYAQKNDPTLPARRIKYHQDMVCFFHHQFSYLLSRIAARPLRPSHDYFYSYGDGSVLRKHVDIDEEEFTVSFLLDYEPEPLGVSPWPLFLESPKEGELQISQELGNAVFYNGSEIPHYRKALPVGHRSVSFVFHYVPQNFRGC